MNHPETNSPGPDRRPRQKKPPRDGRSPARAWLHSNHARCGLITLFCAVILLVLFYVAARPERYDLSVGSVSPATITATKDVEDTVTTAERRRSAAAAIEPTYHLDETAADTVNALLKQVFEELRSVQLYGLTLRSPEDTA